MAGAVHPPRERGARVSGHGCGSMTEGFIPLHPLDAGNCCAGLMATPVLNTQATSRICRRLTRRTEDGAVAGWVSAPPPGRSALLGEPGPGPPTAPNEGRRVRRRQIGAPPGRRPWARIATTRTENSEGIQNRRNPTSNTERTKGTDTRERRTRRAGRGHVEERSRDGSARWRRITS